MIRPARAQVALFAIFALFASLAVAAPTASAAPKSGGSDLEVFVGDLSPAQLDSLAAVGLDREDVFTGKLRAGKIPVEIVMSERLGRRLQGRGFDIEVKRIDGKKASTLLAKEARQGYDAYRSYSEDGGIRDELVATAKAHPGLAKLVNLGKTVQGQDILALKVTRHARWVKDGRRPAVLYGGAQHAREWITPGDDPPAHAPLPRRLRHRPRDPPHPATPPSCGSCRCRTRTATTSPSPRATGCGARTCATTTATGRSPAATASTSTATSPRSGATTTRAPRPRSASETYRGPGAHSEPETKALDRLFDKVGFEFYVNYHSAAELLLYGIGWQVSTPTPGRRDLRGDGGRRREPRGAGLRPGHLRRALHHQRRHRHPRHGRATARSGFTPEMTTCEVVSDSDPDDEWEAEDCVSGFNFPRRRGADPGRVREEHPVRPVGRQVGAGPGRPGLRRSAWTPRTWSPTRSASRTARRSSRSRSRRSGRCGSSGCTTPSTAGARGRRASRSGRAASATATRTTTTTPSSAARWARPGPGTR